MALGCRGHEYPRVPVSTHKFAASYVGAHLSATSKRLGLLWHRSAERTAVAPNIEAREHRVARPGAGLTTVMGQGTELAGAW